MLWSLIYLVLISTIGTHEDATSFNTIDNGCILKLKPKLQAFYISTDEDIVNNTKVKEFAPILFKCREKYKLTGERLTICVRGEWSAIIPKCAIACSSNELQHPSTTVSCQFKNSPISCKQKLLPKTIVKIKCNNGYIRPDIHFSDVIQCDADGEWDHSILHCEQMCGINTIGRRIGSTSVNNTQVPWHVGIYSDVDASGNFEQICGGTIISAKAVISAAHCFWDESKQRMHDKLHYRIGIGKYYRDYEAVEPLETQRLQISELFHYKDYRGWAQYHAFDIAIIIVSEFIIFTFYVVPICVEYNLTFRELDILDDRYGIVAGWGKSNSSQVTSSKTLKIVDLTTVEFSKCKQETPSEFKEFITKDKFCATNINQDNGVFQGDSGGGLAVPKYWDGRETYFLAGIVSVGANIYGDTHGYIAFTNVHYFQVMMKSVI